MNNYKAEQLADILNGAKDAKPIEGMENTYDPENYNKIYNAQKVLADMQNSEWLVPQIDTGAFEYDERTHRPKSIGRYRPAMLDLNVFAMNLYKKSTKGHTSEVEVEEEYEDKKTGTKKTRKKNKKVTVKETFIHVIFGRATVTAIREMREIGNAVKAHIFSKREGGEWFYEGSELVQKDEAYKFTSTLDVKSAMQLMKLMQDSVANEHVEGDSLEDVA